MRTSTGALFAVTSVAIAAGVWSTLGTAAGLVGAYDPSLREPTAAQQVMDRFPRETESFKPFGFVRPPEAIGGSRKSERQPVMGAAPLAPGCQSGWPFTAQDCLPQAKPRAVERTVTTERRSGTTSTLTRTAAAAAAPTTTGAAPASTAPNAPACKQNLAAVMARVDKAVAQAKGARGARAEACTTYRQDFFALVQAREMTALCKSGAERDQDLERIDLAVEDINGAIAQSCGS
jgi:hypothetical protein